MKNNFIISSLVFFLIFSYTTTIAQMPDKVTMEKIKEMQKKYNGSTGKGTGKISYTVNNKTYTCTDGISTVIIDGKIGDISDDRHNVAIGDGTPHSFKVGQAYSCKSLMLMVDGLQYGRRSKNNMVKITSYNGKQIKGTFSGTVYNEKSKQTLQVTGSFEISNITVL